MKSTRKSKLKTNQTNSIQPTNQIISIFNNYKGWFGLRILKTSFVGLVFRFLISYLIKSNQTNILKLPFLVICNCSMFDDYICIYIHKGMGRVWGRFQVEVSMGTKIYLSKKYIYFVNSIKVIYCFTYYTLVKLIFKCIYYSLD